MRIVVLDYAGHLPQADLAKKLNLVGYEILHLRCTDYLTGNADFSSVGNSPINLEFKGISAGFQLKRYNLVHRLKHEFKLSKLFYHEIAKYDPDHLILCNIPLICATRLAKRLRKANYRYIYWWQDVYSMAINNEIAFRFKFPGITLIQKYITSLEKKLLANSSAVVAISNKFARLFEEWDLDSSKFSIYPNWSAPEDFLVIEKIERPIEYEYFLYAGTLGLKHNPRILVDLADSLSEKYPYVRLVIVSQGRGRDFLEQPNNVRFNIVLKDFLPFSILREYLHDAIGVIAILEPSASEYSVPSKVMTYFCAGKAIIAAVPQDNQIAEYITKSNSGFVVNVLDPTQIRDAAINLLSNPDLRKTLELNARKFAEENFSGERAAALFISLIK